MQWPRHHAVADMDTVIIGNHNADKMISFTPLRPAAYGVVPITIEASNLDGARRLPKWESSIREAASCGLKAGNSLISLSVASLACFRLFTLTPDTLLPVLG